MSTLNFQRLFPLLSKLIRSHRDAGTIELNRKRIYILPTRRGLVFAVFLLAMLLGSINYALSLGFVLTFLLAGLGLVGMLHTYRNLAGVKISAGGAAPVFAGEMAEFYLCFDAPGARPAIGLRWQKQPPQWIDLLEPGQQCAPLLIPATQRGWLIPSRFTVFTNFPLGLFRAWSYADFGMCCLVYPKPLTNPLLPLGESADQSGALATQQEGAEDFSGLREYRLGDAPRHVAWKASTKNEVLLTKQFATPGAATLWFDWQTLREPDTETRLSLLAGMVLEAERLQQAYGLRLPGKEYAPGVGVTQQEACLKALALFGKADTEHAAAKNISFPREN
jgi:uncharacterized protein (DUF58 family)